MLPRNRLQRIHVAFDDHRLVNYAGLILPATLAQQLGLAGSLRAGRTAAVLGCTVKAPSTLGIFLRSFRWGHVRQLDRVGRELLAQAWSAGAGPGDGPLTIDLDSTNCETYGLAKEGARQHNYHGQRGYHPLLAIAAGTGGVLMARLRKGRANTARGAANFLRETVSRVRYAGAKGQITLQADSGFYNHDVVAACRKHRVRFSITVRQSQSLRDLIKAIPEAEWTPIPYWMDGTADVAEAEYTPFQNKPDAALMRLIVRRVKPTPGSQLAFFHTYGYHGFIGVPGPPQPQSAGSEAGGGVLQAPLKVESAQCADVDPQALWERMDAHDISQNETARRAGISSAMLSQIMNGNRKPSGDVLGRLHRVLFAPSPSELVAPVELKVMGWKKDGRQGVVVRGVGGPKSNGQPGDGSIRTGGRMPWGAEVEFAYTTGYDGGGRVFVNHVVDERGYGVMLRESQPAGDETPATGSGAPAGQEKITGGLGNDSCNAADRRAPAISAGALHGCFQSAPAGGRSASCPRTCLRL